MTVTDKAIRIRTSDGWQEITVTGATGPEGPEGPQGDPGADSTVPGPEGPAGATGPAGPKGDTGADSTIAGPQGPTGPAGAKGDTGAQGIQGYQGNPGSIWRTGAGPPATGAGVIGDWYLNVSNGDVYEKTGTSAWTARTNIMGPQGPAGTGSTWRSGAGAPAGALGVIGDWYLNTTNGDVYEKTGASAYTLRDNLTGPQGIQGVQGPAGTNGHSILDEGAGLTQRAGLNFAGAGVTATDDSGNNRTLITIPGGGAGHTIQDEGSALAARTGLNFVGAGVTTTDDSGNDRTLVTIPGASGGTTILSGTATPGSGTGSVGDYYLDTDDNILYGPRATASFGADQSVYGAQVPGASNSIVNQVLSQDVTFAVAGRITALRYYRHASSTVTAHTLKVWNTTTQALLGSAATSGESGAGWKVATLATPLDVAAGQTVRVSVDTGAVSTVYGFTSPNTVIVNGDLTLGNPFTLNAASGYPVTLSSVNWFTDVVFQKATSTPWPVGIAKPTYAPFVTALPGSPTDGQEVYFQNAAMETQGVVWHLRYRSASSSANYKWEFLGGPPFHFEDITNSPTTTSTSYVDIPNLITTTLPLSGDFRIEHGLKGWHSVLNGYIAQMPYIGTGGQTTDELTLLSPGAAGSIAQGHRVNRRNNLASGATVKLQHRIITAGTGTFQCRYISILPIRVAA